MKTKDLIFSVMLGVLTGLEVCSAAAPQRIFIVEQKWNLVADISNQEQIQKVMKFLSVQKPSDCMADYGAYIYYSKDSLNIAPIWKNCCDEKDTAFYSFLESKLKEKKWRRWKFMLPVDFPF